MRILFILENYYPNVGGLETLFKTLVEKLAAAGHEITIITTKPFGGLPFKEIIGNIKIIRLPFGRYTYTFLGFIPILFYIRKMDIIQTTSYNAGIPAIFAGKIFRKKVVITFHEVWAELWSELPFMSKFSKWGHRLFESNLLRLPFDKFVAVSNATANELTRAGIPSDKIEIIHNGIDYHAFAKIKREKTNDKKFNYLYFGRLGVSKGLDLILDAAKKFRDNFPNSKLTMIIPKNPVPFYKLLMKLVREKKLENYIEFKHQLKYEELLQELTKTDCAIIPSYSEGFCYAAVECIALETPIISSDRAALKEVVSGQFIKMETQSADGLYDALVKAVNEEWEYTPIKKFHIDDTITKYIHLYHKMMKA